MKTVTVEVRRDHLETLSKTKKPTIALAELIWNALDADASQVVVAFRDNGLEGLDFIEVSDNGHGLSYDDVDAAFGPLGGSWKRGQTKTKGRRRLLHGRLGKGRFRAFSLGKTVEWTTSYRNSGAIQEYVITGRSPDLNVFNVSDQKPRKKGETGTVVRISDIMKNFRSLRGDDGMADVTEQFALYLREYPDVRIEYEGQVIDPRKLEANVADYTLKEVMAEPGKKVTARLTIIEWANIDRRAMYLCDEHGFALDEISPGIHAPHFNFTAYLKSDYLKELEARGDLTLEDLHPGLKALLDLAKLKLKEHFRQRIAESATGLMKKWKEEKVYPYVGDPKDIIETAERQVFDVCALNVNALLPSFDTLDLRGQRLAFRLLRHALETRPQCVGLILKEVLDLPLDKQEEFAALIERTSLNTTT